MQKLVIQEINFSNDGGLGILLGYYVLEENIHTSSGRLISSAPSKPRYDLVGEQCGIHSKAVGHFFDVVSGPCENAKTKSHGLSCSKVGLCIPDLDELVTNLFGVSLVVKLHTRFLYQFRRVNDPCLDHVVRPQAFHVVGGVIHCQSFLDLRQLFFCNFELVLEFGSGLVDV
nr:MAG TPA: hypothetical protein [Caudoviricetes sp.]